MINKDLLPLLVSRIAFVDISYDKLKGCFPYSFRELHLWISGMINRRVASPTSFENCICGYK